MTVSKERWNGEETYGLTGLDGLRLSRGLEGVRGIKRRESIPNTWPITVMKSRTQSRTLL